MSKIVIAFLVVVIVAGFAIVLTGVNSPTGAFGVDDSLVANPIYLIGSLTLDPDFLDFLEEDKSLLFGPPAVCIEKNFAVRSDFFEVNGILDCDGDTPAGCPVGQCEIVTTLKAEILANQPTTEKERNLVLKIMGDQASPGNLEEVMDCLTNAYSQQSLDVGSDTYFNIIKNCYVRAIKDLGILEQTYIDEPEAFFFVQKLQAIEVDLQHMLAIEDQKAKMAPITVPSPSPTPTPTPFPDNCADLLIGPGTIYSIPCPLNVFDGSTCAADCISEADAGNGCGVDVNGDCGQGGCCYIPCKCPQGANNPGDNTKCLPESGVCNCGTVHSTNDGTYGFCNVNTASAGCCYT